MVFTYYFSTAMTGCPQPSTSAGAMAAFLDAALITGFGSVTVSSIAVTSGIATLVTATSHNMVNAEGLGPIIAVSGATDDADLNGNFRATVLTSNSMTYACPNVANGTYTAGTIAVKRAPMGWEIEFTDTNIRVYRPPAGTRHRLWVNDTAATTAQARGRISSTSIGDTSDQFPTAAQSADCIFGKTTSEWVLIGNDRLFYLRTGNSIYGNLYVFGDYVSYVNSPSYNCLIGSKLNPSSGYAYVEWTAQANSSANGLYLARDASETGAPHNGKLFYPGFSSGSAYCIGITTFAVLNTNAPMAGAKFYGPCQVIMSDKTLIGELPGFYVSLVGQLTHNAKYIGTSLGNSVLLGLQFYGGNQTTEFAGSAAVDLADWY